MARPPKNWVAMYKASDGTTNPILNNPSEEEVRGFVTEHNRRRKAGEPGGPSGIPAFEITEAAFYKTQTDVFFGKKPFKIIDLSDTKE